MESLELERGSSMKLFLKACSRKTYAFSNFIKKDAKSVFYHKVPINIFS